MRRVPLVEQHYQQVFDEKMHDLPIINRALSVKAIGFQEHQGQVLGAVVTPWFMSLLLLPVELEGWRAHQTGEQHFESFPAGDFHFTHAWDARVGAYATSSLFSSMDDFPDQETAERVALRALEQLFVEPEGVATPETEATEAEPTPSQAAVKPAAEPPAPETDEKIDNRRRGLLFGRLFGSR